MDTTLLTGFGMFLCLVTAAFFSLSDVVLGTFGVARAERLVKDGEIRLKSFATNPLKVRTAVLMGKYVGVIGVGVLTPALAVAAGVSLWIGAIVILAVTTVVAEALPRTIAQRHSRVLIAPLLILLRPWVKMLAPMAWLTEHFGSAQSMTTDVMPVHVSEEDLAIMVDVGAKQGALTGIKGRILHSAFEFGDTTVREVMVPRTDLVACPSDATFDEVLRLIVDEGHSRIPVYKGSVDVIEGVFYAKDIFQFLLDEKDEHFSLEALQRPPFFVPETLTINRLFGQFQRAHVHMAIAVDEFGSIAGIVTLEDIIEEFFGEIQDEYDEEEASIVKLSVEHMSADGRVDIDDVGEFFGVEFLDDDDFDTLGGLVVAHLGVVPEPGAHFELMGLAFTVVSATEKRVTRVEVQRSDRLPSTPKEEPEQG